MRDERYESAIACFQTLGSQPRIKKVMILTGLSGNRILIIYLTVDEREVVKKILSTRRPGGVEDRARLGAFY